MQWTIQQALLLLSASNGKGVAVTWLGFIRGMTSAAYPAQMLQ